MKLSKEENNFFLQLCNQFETPFYYYDADILEQQTQKLRSLLPNLAKIYYSVKANPNPTIISLFNQIGLHFELASIGEFKIARCAGVSPDKMIIAGPGKTDSILKELVLGKVSKIVVESIGELQRLISICTELETQQPVLLRLNPGTAASNAKIAMAGDTQFGISPSQAIEYLSNIPQNYIRFDGLHVFHGSNILSPSQIIENTENALQVCQDVQIASDWRASTINLGGGFGVVTNSGVETPCWDDLSHPLRDIINSYLSNFPETKEIAFESGRFLTAQAGKTVFKVVNIKSTGQNHYVILDGGRNIALSEDSTHGFRHPIMSFVSPQKQLNTSEVTICGPLCTPTDRIAFKATVPMPSIGDFFILHNTGAYGLSASSGLFLSHGFPAEIISLKGEIKLIRKAFSAVDFNDQTYVF